MRLKMRRSLGGAGKKRQTRAQRNTWGLFGKSSESKA